MVYTGSASLVVSVVLGVICGPVCAFIAHSKGRNVLGWFFVGLFLNVLGVILSLVSSNAQQHEYVRLRQDDENRRLREQLRQERIKHDTLREYTMRRLDAHDQVLGLDTRAMPALESQQNIKGYLPAGEGNGPQQQQPAQPRSNQWYFAHNGETRGPVPPATIRALLDQGKISGTTLLWADHLPDWRPAELVEDFAAPPEQKQN